MQSPDVTAGTLAGLAALRERLRDRERQANIASDVVSHREDELAAARVALSRAEVRYDRLTALEDQARADYCDALELAGYVDTATGPAPAAPAGIVGRHASAPVPLEGWPASAFGIVQTVDGPAALEPGHGFTFQTGGER